jgi:hypothetical protein
MTDLLYGILRTAYSDIETGIETHVISMKKDVMNSFGFERSDCVT